jgi:hypothetical protein
MFRSSLLAVLVVAVSACGVEGNEPDTAASQGALDTIDGHGQKEPDMLGKHDTRGESRTKGGGGGSVNMYLHGGNVLSNGTAVTAIFWGPNWAKASFTQDKQTGLGQFYANVGGSPYAKTSGEYAGVNGALVSTAVTYSGQIVDTAATPRGAPTTGQVLAEVCKSISNPSSDAYYPVYTDIPRGHASYCAWHSWGQCGGVNVQFGFFFALDGDPGCDPQDTAPGRSQGLSALANVTGHELSETLTDPRGTGWLDQQGGENGDKCAWVFDQAVTLSDGSTWKIQGNWSNAAYTANTGFANQSGQNGCIYSGN